MGEVAASADFDMRKKRVSICVLGGEAVPVGAPGEYVWVWFSASDEWLSAGQQDVGSSFIAR